MLNDPQIIARNRSELQKLKEERIQEEDRVARLQKEAAHLAAQKEDLAVERVLISQSQNLMCTGKVGHEILSKGESKHDKKTL